MSGIHKYRHVDVCRDALTNPEIYNTFKKIPEYNNVLQHCPLNVAQSCMRKIAESDVFSRIPWCVVQKNDEIGSPETVSFREFLEPTVKLTNYNFSTTTILYLYQAIHILSSAASLIEFSIVEIGGGYGGLCYILHTICHLFGKKIKEYTIIDLPDVSKHQKKYLDDIRSALWDEKMNHEGTNINCIDSESFERIEADLVISIYALGEFPSEIANFYVNKVLSHCKYYYIWWNITELHPYFSDTHIEKTGLNIAGRDIIVSNFKTVPINVKSIEGKPISVRNIQHDDYHRGYLELLHHLSNHSYNLSYNDFCDKIRLQTEQNSLILIVEENNRIVGNGKLTIQHKFGDPIGYIDDIVVDPQYRGRGIGSTIVRKLAEIAKGKNCYKTSLVCAEKNVAFYERCGFSKDQLSMIIRS